MNYLLHELNDLRVDWNICETKIEGGKFVFNKKRTLFTEKGVFGLYQLRDSDDISLQLIKVNIK